MPESCGFEEMILSIWPRTMRKQAVRQKSPDIEAGQGITLKRESMQLHSSTRWRFAPLAAPFWMVGSSSGSRCRQLAPTNSSATGWHRRVLEGPWNYNCSSGSPRSALRPQCSRSGKTEDFFRLSNLGSVRSSLMERWVVSVHLRRVCTSSL